MLLKIKGHERAYDIQSMSMLFFPYEKIKISETLRKKDSVKILSEAYAKDGKVFCKTVIYSNKTAYKGISAAKGDDSLSLRDALKRSFYKAGNKATGSIPPWGILTGIRPANTALKLIEEGQSEKEIEEVLTKEYYLLPQKAKMCIEVAKKGILFKKLSDEKSASLFISIPFCPSRCNYCSFVSHSIEKALALLPDYTKTLCKEIEETADEISTHGLEIKSIYVGGGTPTVLSEAQLDEIFGTLSKSIDFKTVLEFTVEAGRPDTITAEKLKILKKHNVSRLCINTQSLNDKVLKAVGRKHTAKDFLDAFSLARQEGFTNINVDLIAGLTEETPESFEKSLEDILILKPENITIHTLCVKRAAFMASGELSELKQRWKDTQTMVDISQRLLNRDGYFPYYMYRQKNTLSNLENTGYSKTGFEGLYNAYMMDDIHTIVGVGAGSVTKIVNPKTKEIKRVFNYKYPYEYLSDFEKTKNKLSQEGCNDIE